MYIGFTVQGESEEELPEQILGAAQLFKLDLEKLQTVFQGQGQLPGIVPEEHPQGAVSEPSSPEGK